MRRLGDLKENATVRGILPNSLVNVVITKWHESAALELTYKNSLDVLALRIAAQGPSPAYHR